MREFKKVKLDGKGGDVTYDHMGYTNEFEHKLSPSDYEHKAYPSDYEHKGYPEKDAAKPVPAKFDESSRYTRPESFYASEELGPRDWPRKYPTKDYDWPSSHFASEESKSTSLFRKRQG